MTIAQFFILSPRGDSIISKDFRGDGSPSLQELFFRKVKFWDKSDAPPVFMSDGVTFLFIRRNSLLIACTTRFNVSPSATLELLNRLAKVIKDYCGTLTEESIRKNFVLIYELLDEMLDYGYPQITSTEFLKSCVHNEPLIVTASASIPTTSSILAGMSSNPKTKPATATNQSIMSIARGGSKQKNEIYVDIIERLTLLFNSSGHVTNSSIDGSILMKSFLSGNPELRVALNEDLIIGRQDRSGGRGGPVVLDDCNFHDCVKLDEFENGRVLHFVPPDGEFSLLNYRITSDYHPPFKIYPTLEVVAPGKMELCCMVRAEIPDGNHGANVVIQMSVPRSTLGVTTELPPAALEAPGCTIEYNPADKKIVWTIRKFNGGSEMSMRARITVPVTSSSAPAASSIANTVKRELGPISMSFEIPMYNVSQLQVRYLRISETHKAYNPIRWVRYITQASSYVCRIQT